MEKNQEIEISKTNRGKEQIILNSKYKFNLSNKFNAYHSLQLPFLAKVPGDNNKIKPPNTIGIILFQ